MSGKDIACSRLATLGTETDTDTDTHTHTDRERELK